jgi:ubiquinone/menaquinone biosynthesis C-methylase UbiE
MIFPKRKTGHASVFATVLAPAPRLLMRLALIERLVDLIPSDIESILEVGPGLGDLSLYLANRFPRTHGLLVDISEQGTEMLKRRFEGNERLSVVEGDFREILRDERFGLVIACEVFEHIQDDDSAFRAVHRLLQPSGYFIFSVPAFMRKWGRADEYAGHYRRYERDDLVIKFKQHGFEIEKLWCYGFPVTHLLRLFYHIYYGKQVSRRPLTMDLATKRSGTERSLVNRFSSLPIATLMTPFFFCQNLTKNTGVGDGYLVLARKA